MTSAEIMAALKSILDPELGYNIVDLGLVYGIKISEVNPELLTPNPELTVTITITLTTPGCPLAPYFIEQIKEVVSNTFNLKLEAVEVIITFDPPWSPEAIEPDLKFQMGL